MHTVIDLRAYDTQEQAGDLPALEFVVDQHQVDEIRMRLWQRRNQQQTEAAGEGA